MSGRDQSLSAKERALKARQLRYRDLTFREIGKLLFNVSRERAYQLVNVGVSIETKQAEIASRRIRREQNQDLAIEAMRLHRQGMASDQVCMELGISLEEFEIFLERAELIIKRRAAHGVF